MGKTKGELQKDTFVGLSALIVVPGGITYTESGSGDSKVNAATVTDTNSHEFPVSNESDGFNYDGGTPSTEHFHIHGMGGDWTNRITPGDTAINIEVPCHETNILQVCGFEAADGSLTVGGKTYKGKQYSENQKTVKMGLIGINDTEDKVFVVKQAKLLAAIQFDPSGVKPLSVRLTGANAASADQGSLGIYDLTDGGE